MRFNTAPALLAHFCLFLCFAFLATPAVASESSASGNLWVAGDNVALNIDSANGNVRLQIPFNKLQSVAVDNSNGHVWLYGHRQLEVYTADGLQLFAKKLPKTITGRSPSGFLVDGNSGNVWLAQGKTLHRIGLNGELLESIRLSGTIRAITLNTDNHQLWVASHNKLIILDINGTQVNKITLRWFQRIHDIAYAPTLNEVWVATWFDLFRYSPSGNRQFRKSTKSSAFGKQATQAKLKQYRKAGQKWSLHRFRHQLAVDGNGGVWLSNSIFLGHVSQGGLLEFLFIPFLPPQPFGIVDITADKRDHSVWVANKNSLKHYAADSRLISTLDNISGIRRIEQIEFHADDKAPILTLTKPDNNAYLSTLFPVLEVTYLDAGSGIDSETLALTVNDEPTPLDCQTQSYGATCQPVTELPEDTLDLSLTVEDKAGNRSEPEIISVTLDVTDPIINLIQPTPGLVTNQTELTIKGQLNEAADITLNGQPVPDDTQGNFSDTVTLREGANGFAFIATDLAGNTTTQNRQVILDTVPPAIPVVTQISISQPDENDQVTITGANGSVEPEARVVIINTRTGESITVMANGQGGFSARLTATREDAVTLYVQDAATNTSDSVTLPVDDDNHHLPPDPAEVAPPLSPTGITPFDQAIEFLYTGDNPIQRGVAPNTIKGHRVSVLRGQVRTRSGEPLSGVKITILNHPELGHTLTRTDGMFDMAVNGGGQLTINYRKKGYLPVQRTLQTNWNQWYWADDVVMIPLSDKVTTIDLTDQSHAFQVARGEVIHGEDGTRQATLLFPAGLIATMTTADGEQIQLSQLDIRATEYTIGDTGPQAMPGKLPPASAYTYAVELSVDQVLENGEKIDGKGVVFNKPVSFYVDNFLNFPTGGAVPTGYYNADTAAWIPYQSGRVVEILSIQNGMAILDVTGEGNPATAQELNELGISDAERKQLAQLYEAGDSLWRVRLTHLSTWDCNWPYGPPEDAVGPEVELPDSDENEDTDEENECEGCIIRPQSQSLGENIKIAGAPFSLAYQSQAAKGYITGNILIPLTDGSPPASLDSVKLEVVIAGQHFAKKFSPKENLSYTFIWDGTDAFGRKVYGSAEARIKLSYIYEDCRYLKPGEFGFGYAPANIDPIGTINRCQGFEFWQMSEQLIESPISSKPAIGNWAVSIEHDWHGKSGVIVQGNGEKRYAWPRFGIVSPVVNEQDSTQFSYANSIAAGIDGSLYVVDTQGHQIKKISPTGNVTVIAGTGVRGFSGDGGLAINAKLNFPQDVSVGPEGDIYIADTGNHRIRKITPDGKIITIAGTGDEGFSGDGGLAIEASLASPLGIALSQDGSLYIADRNNNRIRRIAPTGIITTVAGTGEAGYFGDGGLAINAKLNLPADVALGPNGNVYIADTHNHRVRKVASNGIITTIAGTGEKGFSGDGSLAINAKLYFPSTIDVGSNGIVYIADTGGEDDLIRQVQVNGIIETIAGGGEGRSGGPARDQEFTHLAGLAIGFNDEIYFTDYTVLKLSRYSVNTRTNRTIVPSEDASRVFIFDEFGRHLQTVSTLTNTVIYEFERDNKGRLLSIRDRNGNKTIIQRDNQGKATAIISPYGQYTALKVDDNGHLIKIIDPKGKHWTMQYTPDGLLTQLTNRIKATYKYHYNDVGRLIAEQGPNGSGWRLQRTDLAEGDGYQVQMISGEGRQYQFVFEQIWLDRHYTDISPSGLKTLREYRYYGGKTIEYPNGTIVTSANAPDPRFGVQSPFVGFSTITTPAGLQKNIELERQVIVSDNILTPEKIIRSTSINQRAQTATFIGDTKTWTIQSAAGRTITIKLDEDSRPVSTAFENLLPVQYFYNSNGRLMEISHGARNTSFTYANQGAGAGYVASITGPLDNTVSFKRDEWGNVLTQTLPDGRVIRYQYDAAGRRTAIIPPGRDAHVFDYTALDQTNSYTPPDISGAATVTRYTYNADKQLTGIDLAGSQQINYDYNPSGKLEVRQSGIYSNIYSYKSATGQLDTIKSTSGIDLAFSYDGFLLTDIAWSGPVSGNVEFIYDDNFWLDRITVGNREINLNYDNDGLITDAGELDIAYGGEDEIDIGLVKGTEISVTNFQEGYTNTIKGNKDYNLFGELISRHVILSKRFEVPSIRFNELEEPPLPEGEDVLALYSVEYDRDKAGRIITETETIGGITHTFNYEYDPSGRLTKVLKDAILWHSYTYDKNSNRISHTGPEGTQVGTYDAQDRLASYASISYTHNPAGHRLSKTTPAGTTNYNYDAIGNLRSVSLPDGTQIEYLIDGQDRRVGKKINGTLVKGWLYRDKLNVVAQLDANGNIVQRYVYGPKTNVPAYMIVANSDAGEGPNRTIYRIISDHLGSVRLVVKISTGEIVQRIDYSPFGKVILDTNPGFQPFGFAGGLYDHHTGLVRFGARDYDAQVGRWTAKDPILFAGGQVNLYGYVVSDPVNFVDLTGLSKQSINHVEPTRRVGGKKGKIPGIKVYGPYPGKKTVGDKIADAVVKQALKQLLNKMGIPPALLGNPYVALPLLLFYPSELACSTLDCNKNGIPDNLEPNYCTVH